MNVHNNLTVSRDLMCCVNECEKAQKCITSQDKSTWHAWAAHYKDKCEFLLHAPSLPFSQESPLGKTVLHYKVFSFLSKTSKKVKYENFL